MRGSYKVYQHGDIIAACDNLLTDKAAATILRYLAGETRSWAGAIAVGAVEVPAAVTDTRLRFELGRGTVTIHSANIEEGSIVAKATIPRDVVGVIHELGLFASPKVASLDSDQSLITDFNAGVLETTGVTEGSLRIGRASSIIQGHTIARFTQIGFDFSAAGPGDKFLLAYESDNITSVEIRLKNDASAYIAYSFTPAGGYNVEEWGLPDFTATNGGTAQQPFDEIEVVAVGAGEIELDGFRIDDANEAVEHSLVSRAVLDNPIRKTNAIEMDIEYTITLDF